MTDLNFTAIDFETANEKRFSACAIGLVRYEKGVAVEQCHHLIRPPEMRFSPWNVKVHGITPAMVEKAPTFNQLWPSIEPFFQEGILVAHNAPFDQSVLEQTARMTGISLPPLKMICTLKMARHLLPKLSSHKLNILCHLYDISLDHHQALSDASGCGQLFVKLLKGSKPQTPHSRPAAEISLSPKGKAQAIIPDNPLKSKKVVITGQFVQFTREEICYVVEALGGLLQSAVNGRTQVMIQGIRPGPMKMQKLQALTQQGQKVKCLNEKHITNILEKLKK